MPVLVKTKDAFMRIMRKIGSTLNIEAGPYPSLKMRATPKGGRGNSIKTQSTISNIPKDLKGKEKSKSPTKRGVKSRCLSTRKVSRPYGLDSG